MLFRSTFYGWFLDSQNTLPNPSTCIVNSSTNVQPGFGGTSYGIYVYGTQVKDVFIRNWEFATGTNGIWVESTVGTNNFDVEISDCVIDTFYGEGIVLKTLAGASVLGCWINPAVGATNSIRIQA